MKIFEYTLRGTISLVALGLFAQGSFAYAPTTTHAGLTQEIVSFYEAEKGEFFSDEQGELIIQASIDEDNPATRALNHFFDPIHGTGINDYRSAYEWATNEFSGNEFIWRAGIEAYARGDERMAMLVLGHVLHLVEDSSVPDHTRNDPHIGHGLAGLYTGASPFEDWTDQTKTRGSMRGLGGEFYDGGWRMSDCYDIRICFEFIALYSNQNFFSADTIGMNVYSAPTQTSGDYKYGYGQDSITGNEVKLFVFQSDKEGKEIPSLINKQDFSVLEEYWERLAPQTIAVGARVIDLYMTEAKYAREKYLKEQKEAQEKAVAEQMALNNKLSNSGLFGHLVFGLSDFLWDRPVVIVKKGGVKLASAGDGFLRGYTSVFDEGVRFTNLAITSAERGAPYAIEKGQNLATNAVAVVVSSAENAYGNAQQISELFRKLAQAQETLNLIAAANQQSLGHPMSKSEGEVLGASTEAVSEELGHPMSKLDEAQGGATGGFAYVFQSQTASFEASPPLGGEASGISSEDTEEEESPPSGGDTSESEEESSGEDEDTPEETEEEPPPEEEDTPAPETPAPDTTAPSAPIVTTPADFSSPFATTSVVFAGTAEATSTVIATWDDGPITYVISTSASEAGEWGVTLILPEGTTTVAFSARDEAGNVSSTTDIVLAITLPEPEPVGVAPVQGSVIINEIMWGPKNPEDEWIELYNTTPNLVDLSGVILSIDSVDITLTGTIAPRGYYVIARERDDGLPALSDPILDLVAVFDLPDAGVPVTLLALGGEAIDELPYCVNWCGKGGGANALSMERHRADLETSNYAENWGVNLGYLYNWGPQTPYLTNGTDTSGAVVGTPGKRNSINYLFTLGDSISGDFAATASTYLSYGWSGVNVQSGNTLTIDPGVTVKFMPTGDLNNSGIIVRGALVASGTPELPITFTTIDDDDVAGDIFGNGTTSIARTGSLNIVALGSQLSYVDFKHLIGVGFTKDTSIAYVTLDDVYNGLNVGLGATLSSLDLLITNSPGTALYGYNNAKFSLASTTISDAQTGIYLSDSQITATNTEITGTTYAGIILSDTNANGNPEALFRDLKISTATGTAVSLTSASSTIDNLSISDIVGGGIVVNGGTLNLSNATITDTTTGLRAVDTTVTITESTIEGNSVAGISETNSTVTIDENTVVQ